MKNIHVLPTDKPSRLVKIYNDVNRNNFTLKLDIEVNDSYKEYQNIYITNDEETKDGDWLIVNDEDVMQMKSSYDNDMSGEDIWVGDSLNGYATYKDNCKKIILTTDQSLDGVQAIDDEFLEWFIKNPSCEDVKVIKHMGWEEYKIIIPKEEPKKKHIVMLVGDKVNDEQTKCYCGHTTYCDCGPETLEEVAERLYPNKSTKGWIDQYSAIQRIHFIEGAKWQQETHLDIKDNKIELLEEDLECIRMYLDDLKIPVNDKDGNKYSIIGRIKLQQKRRYSEEEVLDILFSMSVDNPNDITEWFEQF